MARRTGEASRSNAARFTPGVNGGAMCGSSDVSVKTKHTQRTRRTTGLRRATRMYRGSHFTTHGVTSWIQSGAMDAQVLNDASATKIMIAWCTYAYVGMCRHGCAHGNEILIAWVVIAWCIYAYVVYQVGKHMHV